MNTSVKIKYLDDVTEDLQAMKKTKMTKVGAKEAQHQNKEMQKQMLMALHDSFGRLQNVEEYQVGQICGESIKGPMKWVVLILGPNHKLKDVRSLI